MIASLGMYDWPQLRVETDRLWALVRDGLAAEGIEAPAELTRDGSLPELWENPDLVLAHTCGMPYRMRLHGRVALVGTPDYGLPGAAPGHYYSVLVTRRDEPGEVADFLARRLAFNAPDSQSGWAAPQNHVAPLAFTRTRPTGAHRDSAAAVAAGEADIAAIDAVTWRLLGEHLPELAAGLRVIARTAPTPGLPLITARHRDPAPIARAFARAVAALRPEDRARLGLRGLAAIPASAYLGIPTPPPPPQVVAADEADRR